MAQLRQDYDRFHQQNAEIVVIGPEGAKAFQEFWTRHRLPFIGLPNPDHSVLKRYGQKVNLFRLGRLPAQAVIDPQGIVRYIHYGKSMKDIPSNEELLATLQELNVQDHPIVTR